MLDRMTTALPADMTPQGGGNQHAGVLDWLRKVLYILVSLDIGLWLVCLPWFGFWDNNYLLYLYPQFRPVVTNSFFKGFVVGLGIVNIMIGIHEFVRIKDFSKKTTDLR